MLNWQSLLLKIFAPPIVLLLIFTAALSWMKVRLFLYLRQHHPEVWNRLGCPLVFRWGNRRGNW